MEPDPLGLAADDQGDVRPADRLPLPVPRAGRHGAERARAEAAADRGFRRRSLPARLWPWPAPRSRRTQRAAQPVQVFVLAGQSNIVGRGCPAQRWRRRRDPRLLRLARDGRWQTAVGPARRPPNDPSNGVGPGMTFGLDAMLKRLPSWRIGLVDVRERERRRSRSGSPRQASTGRASRQVRAAGGRPSAGSSSSRARRDG